MAVEFNPNIQKGLFTRSYYDSSSGKIKMTPEPSESSWVGSGDWDVSGTWVLLDSESPTFVSPFFLEGQSDAGDIYYSDNPNGDNHYLQCTEYYGGSSSKLRFQVKVKAKGIEHENSDPSYYGIRMVITHTEDGLSGVGDTFEEVELPFPNGSFDWQSFAIEHTPAEPAVYVYFYVFARSDPGQVWVKDPEVLHMSDEVARQGYWESEVQDLYKLMSAKCKKDGIPQLETFGYEYNYVTLSNGLMNSQTIFEELSQFDHIVTHTPLKPINHSDVTLEREKALIQKLIGVGVKVWGYTYLDQRTIAEGGAGPLTLAELQTEMDACKADGYYGIFLDTAGWDYEVSRSFFNDVVDYAHGIGLKAFANAWNPHTQLLANTYDATWNPGEEPTSLTEGDWVLLESFVASDSGFRDDFIVQMDKYTETVRLSKELSVKVATLTDQITTHSTKNYRARDLAYHLALILDIDGFAFGGTPVQFLPPTNYKYGSEYAGTYAETESGVWERPTDEGSIWFKKDGSAFSSGVYSTDIALIISRPSDDEVKANFEVELIYDITWLTSDNKADWVEWKDGVKPLRYAKLKVEMRGRWYE